MSQILLFVLIAIFVLYVFMGVIMLVGWKLTHNPAKVWKEFLLTWLIWPYHLIGFLLKK